MMESGIFLEERVVKFCQRNNQDEGYIWRVINNIHTRDYGKNLMWEKQKFQEVISNGIENSYRSKFTNIMHKKKSNRRNVK